MGKHNPIVVDYAKCSPCSALICIGVCPLGVLEKGTDGKPTITDEAYCNRCGVCASLCPTQAITITQNSKSK
ncbi:MAG: 4Fe-4S binding protein [Candidatus Bathyarchaeia archaeon]|jgi:NAD-dependent dihydropyrimidine dehydrogenase PreA subunit